MSDMSRKVSATAIAATTVAAPTQISSRSATMTAALFLALLGAGMIYGVGFAGADLLHNAAHDVRHSNAFPCH